MVPNTYLRDSDVMVEFQPGRFVAEQIGARLGIVRPREPGAKLEVGGREIPVRNLVLPALPGDRADIVGPAGTVSGTVQVVGVSPASQTTEMVVTLDPPEAQRKTIRLLKKLGNSPREIAAKTGFPVNVIKAVLAG